MPPLLLKCSIRVEKKIHRAAWIEAVEKPECFLVRRHPTTVIQIGPLR